MPKAEVQILAFRVLQVFPGSVGMGVGFSVLVDAPFDKTRRALERAAGKPLKTCDTSDGMRSCELQLAEQRTLMLTAGDGPHDRTTLLGCYYYYER